MPKIPTKSDLTVPQLRVLHALADGGALTLEKLGAESGMAGAASGAACAGLAALGLVQRHEFDMDGRLEVAWAATKAGEARLARASQALPDLEARRDGELPKVKALVPVFGSNRLLGPEVGKALAGCQWVGVPFAGSLAELPYIGARTLLCNDLHSHIINLATVAKDVKLGPQLLRRLKRWAFHPKALAQAQELCLGKETEDEWDGAPDLEWAEAYFVSAWMARNGEAGKSKEFNAGLAVRWTAGGGDSAVRFRSAVESLKYWRRLLARVSFECMDAFDFIDKVKDGPGTGTYCDPPFPGPGDAYKFKFSEDEHRRLAKRLVEFNQARVVCRFYDVPLIRQLYQESQWEWRRFVGRKASNAQAPEVLLVRNGGSE